MLDAKNKGKNPIFELITDKRAKRIRVLAGAAGVIIHLVLLSVLAILWQLSEFHRFSSMLGADLQKELKQYRVLLIIPKLQPSKPLATPKPEIFPLPEILETGQPKLLDRLDGNLVDFIEKNPEIDNIVTSEIEKDFASHKLDIYKLLAKSRIRISFGLDSQGRIQWRRIDESSNVPSIDHLALALIQLLEKYRLLRYVNGIEQISFSIRIDERIELELTGKLLPEADPEALRGQIDAGLLLWRLFVTPEEAKLLQNIIVETHDRQISLGKTFEKNQLVQILKEYYEPVESR